MPSLLYVSTLFDDFLIYLYRLSGTKSFNGKGYREMIKLNKYGCLDFPRYPWEKISSEAKEFILSMTNLNTKLRPNAKEALNSKWIKKYFRDKDISYDEILINNNEFEIEINKFIIKENLNEKSDKINKAVSSMPNFTNFEEIQVFKCSTVKLDYPKLLSDTKNDNNCNSIISYFIDQTKEKASRNIFNKQVEENIDEKICSEQNHIISLPFTVKIKNCFQKS